MRAAVIASGSLVVAERPDPIPGAGELLVRVRAAGLNNADLLQIRGLYPAPAGVPADIPGLELAGEVVAAGPSVTRFAVGDPVMAVVAGGALAELAVVHESCLLRVPDGIDFVQAGAFPEAFTTAHDALVTQAGLVCGERVCVHGAAGGVGVAAVQIAALLGASVVATVRTEALRAQVEALARAAGGPLSVCSATGPEGFGDRGPYDVILELVGGAAMADNIRSLALGGRISVIGVAGSGGRSEIDLLALMTKRARLMGSTLRARPLEHKADAAARVARQLLPHLASGRLSVPILATYPLAAVNEGYDRFRAGAKLGKIAVTLD